MVHAERQRDVEMPERPLEQVGQFSETKLAYLKKPMPTLRQMETLNMDRVAPILIRIYKEENTLEVWKQNRTGRFALLKSYPICKFSGKLGPKIIQAAI